MQIIFVSLTQNLMYHYIKLLKTVQFVSYSKLTPVNNTFITCIKAISNSEKNNSVIWHSFKYL